MKEAVLTWFNEIDYLGREFMFEFKQNTRHKSPYGAFFSLITFVAALVFAILFGQEVYKRKNPNISMLFENIDDSILYLQDFPLIFTFYNARMQELNFEETFDTTIQWINFPENPSEPYQVFLNFSLVPCIDIIDRYSNHSDTQSFVKTNVADSPYNYYCLNFTENLYIRKEATVPGSSYINIFFNFCDPEVRSNCKYYKENNTTDGAIIALGFLDRYPNSIDFDNPIVSYFKRKFMVITDGLNKILYFHLTQDIFVSDDGWITENNREISYFTFSSEVDINLISQTKNVLSVVLDSPRLRKKTMRSYLKIQELFARVGGLANAFMITVKILTYHFFQYKYYFFVREQSFNSMHGEKPKEGSFNSKIKRNVLNNEKSILSNNMNNIGHNANIDKVSIYVSGLQEVNKRIEEDKVALEKIRVQEFKEVNQSNEVIIKNSNIMSLHQQAHNDNKINKNSRNQIECINQEDGGFSINRRIFEERREVEPEFDREKSKHKESDQDQMQILELKKELSCSLEKQRSLLEASNINYWNYFRTSFFPCCASDDLKSKYKYEINRITEVLNIKFLYQFLVKSYPINNDVK